jgi:hypothetical protein
MAELDTNVRPMAEDVIQRVVVSNPTRPAEHA